MSFLEEDLTCPICCDIFDHPVLLSCSHSFCVGCLKRYWKTGQRECPVCRKKATKSNPPCNLALKNLCEALREARSRSAGPETETEAEEEKGKCELHGEKLKLFCLVDKQPICVVCQTSKLHKSHDCSPVEEAALDCKDELSLSLKSLQDKLENLKRIRRTSAQLFDHIKAQALGTEKLIKLQFEQLHQVLYDEEAARLAALKAEEGEKVAGLKDKMKEVSAEMASISDTISLIEDELREEDLVLLENYRDTQERVNSAQQSSDCMSGGLMDVAKHLCNLKYRIWEKMLDHIEYSPVTLDPNSAHPCLVLSGDLTSLVYSKQPSSLPDNPERFHISAEAVGMSALGSGSHHWVVETGSNQDWLLGVASASVPRNVEVAARPENGFWTLCFRDGALRAMTSPPTPLTLTRKPEQVKVQLDYDKGMVSFFDHDDESLLYAFTYKFKETLLPYFYTQSNFPIRILPEKVFITMLRQ